MGKTESFKILNIRNHDFRFCVELPIKMQNNNMKKALEYMDYARPALCDVLCSGFYVGQSEECFVQSLECLNIGLHDMVEDDSNYFDFPLVQYDVDVVHGWIKHYILDYHNDFIYAEEDDE